MRKGVDRREFVKAIGAAGALSAVAQGTASGAAAQAQAGARRSFHGRRACAPVRSSIRGSRSVLRRR